MTQCLALETLLRIAAECKDHLVIYPLFQKYHTYLLQLILFFYQIDLAIN